jgi:Protein of unknown function (DUF1360)
MRAVVPTKDAEASPTEAAVRGAVEGYAPARERPLLFYAVLTAILNGLIGAGLLAARRADRELPRPGAGDVALVGVASHKFSRLVSKDKATSWLRAPFTELEGKGGPSEFKEAARGRGARKAIGELLICPYCLGLWFVTAFSFGLVFAPRPTRFLAGVFSALTVSDFLQVAYKAAEEKGLG